jgi:hypothetical protein
VLKRKCKESKLFKKCAGPEWESLRDSLDDLELNQTEGAYDSSAHMNEIKRLITEAGFDLEEALDILQVEDEEAWADFVCRAISVKSE